MLVRPVRIDAWGRMQPAGQRRGAVLPWFILCGPVLLLCLIWSLFVTTHRHRQEELKVAAEAAACAGCNYLVDEVLLTDHPRRFELVAERARAAAVKFAHYNRVDGEPLQLHANLSNSPEGEVLLGQLPNAFSRDFFHIRDRGRDSEKDDGFTSPQRKQGNDPTDFVSPQRKQGNDPPEGRQDKDRDLLALAGLDAVRVQAERCGTAAAATAWVDRHVIGFRPQGLKPMPVVPLAILSDPFGPCHSAHTESWEWSIEARQGTFQWKHDKKLRRHRQCEHGEDDDHIPEITVTFSTITDQGNGRALWIGAENSGDLARQTWEGLSRHDLRELGGELLMPATHPLFLPRLKLTKNEMEDLAEALTGLRETGERRIWMLYSPQFDTKRKDSVKMAGVLGFVAAQVLNVQLHKDKLVVVLQPGMRITDTAITDAGCPHEGPRPIWNPYVCRVRLVE